MNSIVKTYLILGALAAGLLYWVTQKGNAKSIGLAVSHAAVDITAGAVEGVATVVGIPETNEEKCARALKNRDSMDVSLYCPALTWLKYEKDAIFGSDVAQQTKTDNATPATPPAMLQ